jgi:4-hydroxy-4-methyl-2-oxoglutarate aldolase
MNARLQPEQVRRFLELGAATIYEAQGQRGAICASIKPIDISMSLAGPALTVDCGPADNLMLHAALSHACPGDILVADARGFTDAGAWGDILTAAAQKVGVAGLVINGAVRDAAAIVTMGFPVFAKGLSIRGTSKLYKGSIGESVDVAGTIVNNGDIIVGDRDGLVVIAADELEESLSLAESRDRKEAGFREKISEGVSTVELLGLSDTLTAYFPAERR